MEDGLSGAVCSTVLMMWIVVLLGLFGLLCTALVIHLLVIALRVSFCSSMLENRRSFFDD
jgi:hypothetical protein